MNPRHPRTVCPPPPPNHQTSLCYVLVVGVCSVPLDPRMNLTSVTDDKSSISIHQFIADMLQVPVDC